MMEERKMNNSESSISTMSACEDKPSLFRVYLIVTGVSTIQFSTGAVMGWSSPMIPQLNLTSSIEASLVGSLYSLGAAPGPFIITFCLDTIGRKGMIYVLWSFFVISWIMLLLSKNIYLIYTARLVGGIGVGGACAGVPIYVSEMATTDIRGRLGSLSYMFIAMGTLLIDCIGPFVDYYAVSVYGLFLAVMCLIIIYFLPESPYYFITKGKRKEASDSLQMVRGYATKEKLEKELEDIENTIIQDKKTAMSLQAAVKSPIVLKATGISIFLVVMQQFACANPINAYCQPIFEHAKLNFSAAIVPIIYLTTNLFGFMSVILVNEYIKLKTALLISGFGCALFTGLLGLYFYLVNNGVDLYDYSYLSVVALVLDNLFIGIGVGPLIWHIVTELFPQAIKATGTGVSGFISSLLGFGCIGCFAIVSDQFGHSTSFFGFAALMLVSSIITIFYVPDTTGMSFQEIQDMLAK